MRASVLRRRGRVTVSAGPTEVEITPDGGGTWALLISGANPAAGEFTDFEVSSDVPPQDGDVAVELGPNSNTIVSGATDGSIAGPIAHAGGAVSISAVNTGAINEVTVQGTVTYTRTSDGAVYIFTLLPFTIFP